MPIPTRKSLRYNSGYLRNVVRRFENAVENYAFRGTIPAGESEAAAQAYACVTDEYHASKATLINLLDRMNQ